MKIHSYGKKLMAVACAVVMLVSCMVFAPVSAAVTSLGSWDLESASTNTNRAWGEINSSSNNKVANEYSMKQVSSVEGAHSGTGVAVAKYIQNGTALTDARGDYLKMPAGRLGIGTTNQCLAKGTYYRVVFWYKVVNMPVDADILLIAASINWAGAVNNTPSVLGTVQLKTTTKTDEWMKADLIIQNTNLDTSMAGLHVVLKTSDNTQSAGTEVWLDDFEYYTFAESDLVTVTLGPNYAGAATTTEKGLSGMPISTVLTREGGYTFLGWFTEAEGGDQVEKFPDADTTLYAHWDEPQGTWYTVTFHAKGGTLTGGATAMYEDGAALTMTDPVRPGWEFLGWYDAAENGTKIETVTGNIDVYAHWKKVGTVAEIDGLQSFEASADLAMKRFTWVEGEENHTFAGNGALKVAVNSVFSQRGRPRLILQSNGQDLIVEPGKSYTVSFWMRTVKNAYNAGYYLATMADNSRDGDIQKEAANQASNEKSDVHKLQTLTSTSVGTFYYGGAESTDGKGTEVGKMALKAGEWTQVTATFTAEAQVDGKPSYLALGLVSEKNGALVGCDFYIDDIQVAETDTLADVHTYEAKETGKYSYNNGEADKLAGTGNGREVTDEVMNHSFGLGGVGHTAKVTLHYKNDKGEQWAYNNYNDCITGLYNADATIRKVTPGNTCLVSAWLYSATETTVGVQLYTAGSAGSWLVAPNETIATKQVALAANTWTQVTLAGAVPTITKDGITCQYLALAFANTAENGEAGATEAVYVDDTKVQELGALKEFSGNVALYVNGNDARYDGQHGALRLLGGYRIADGQYDKATINGVTYTVKQRGIILANESQTNLSLFSKEGQHCIKISTAKNLAKVCWTESKTKDFITYSLLLKGFSSTTADTKYNFRPYVTVDMDGEEVTFYGKLSTVSWNAAVKQYESVNGVTLDKDLVK